MKLFSCKSLNLGSPFVANPGCDSPTIASQSYSSGFANYASFNLAALRPPSFLGSAHNLSFNAPHIFANKVHLSSLTQQPTEEVNNNQSNRSASPSPHPTAALYISGDFKGSRGSQRDTPRIHQNADEEDFVAGDEEEDEDSVNIDDVGYENTRDSPDKLVNPHESGYSDFPSFPYGYRDHHNQNQANGGSGYSEELVRNCDSDRNRINSSAFGHFSAFRYPQAHGQENASSPSRHSPESSHSRQYSVKPQHETRPSNSESPENLPSAPNSGLFYNTPNSAAMLEHKLPFNFLGPPLAALHSMTEMKSSIGGGDSNNNNSTSAPSMSSPNAGLTAQTMHGQANAPNPHGIDTILSRPPPVTSAGLSSLTAGEWRGCGEGKSRNK